jgi:hypothetical protein
VALKSSVYRHVFSQARHVFVIEHYLQSQSYLKRQDDFWSAFPKVQVPEKSTVFRLVARSRETGSGRPAVLNYVSVENIRRSLVQTAQKFQLQNKNFRHIEMCFNFYFLKFSLRKFSLTLYMYHVSYNFEFVE